MKKLELRQIIKEEIQNLSEARKLFPEDCQPGKKYKLGYRSNTFESMFVKWKVDKSGPRMIWKNVGSNAGEWEAYMFKGLMAVGSSGDKLLISSEI